MTNTRSSRTWRGPIELALAVSVFAVAAALALRWFAGVSESWIVLGTIIGASIIGWRQPEARVRPALVPVRARSGRSRLA